MAKILFINPVVREEDEPRHVPYGIALLASLAMKDGHLVQVYDANAWRASDAVLAQVLQADAWDVVGVGGITTAYAGDQAHRPDREGGRPGGSRGAGWRHPDEHASRHDAPPALGGRGRGGRGLRLVPRPAPARGRRSARMGRHQWARLARPLRSDAPESRAAAAAGHRQLPYPAWELFPLDIYFKNSMALFSEEGMLARRRLDINASYGCSLICRFCFHLGISGDMKHEENERGERDVKFTYDRQDPLPRPPLRREPREVRAGPLRRGLHRISRREPHDHAPVLGQDAGSPTSPASGSRRGSSPSACAIGCRTTRTSASACTGAAPATPPW